MSFTGKEGHCNLSNWTETRQKLDWTDRKIFHHSINRPNRFDGAERGQHGSAMHWCTAWSFKLHGESGLRGRDAYAETSPNITGLYILYWLWCHNTFSSFPSGQSSVSFQNWFHFVDFLPPSAFELLEWLQDRSRPFKSIQDPAFFFRILCVCRRPLNGRSGMLATRHVEVVSRWDTDRCLASLAALPVLKLRSSLKHGEILELLAE